MSKLRKFLASPLGTIVKVALTAAAGAAAQELHVPYLSDAMRLFLASLGAVN